MEPELFLLEMAESEECNKIMYKRLAIHKYIGLYYAMKRERGVIDPFMIPFRHPHFSEPRQENGPVESVPLPGEPSGSHAVPVPP